MNVYVSKIRNAKVVYSIMLILTVVSTIAYIDAKCRDYSENIVMLIFALLLAEITIFFILLIPLIVDSYLLVDDKIIIWSLFKKKEIVIANIPTLIVTNNINSGQSIYTVRIRNNSQIRVVCPLIGIIDKEIKAINCHYNRPINNWDIKQLIENDDAEYIYGLMCNQDIIRILKKNYKGELYIARTVFENFKDEISKIYEDWEYENKKIIILWDENMDGDFCNSPYL